MKKNESVQGKDSHLITNEDTKVVENFGTAPIDSIAAFSPGMQESDGNMQSSFQTEGTVPFHWAVSLIIIPFALNYSYLLGLVNWTCVEIWMLSFFII